MKDYKHVGESEPEEHFAYAFITLVAMAGVLISGYILAAILVALEYV